MKYNAFCGQENIFGLDPETLLVIILILAIWSLIWKGFALWKSAKNNQSAWFIILLVVNTVGILEIIYLVLNRNKKIENTQKL